MKGLAKFRDRELELKCLYRFEIYGRIVGSAPPYHDAIKWKHFPRYWPFVKGIHRHRWIPLAKVSDAELWCFL